MFFDGDMSDEEFEETLSTAESALNGVGNEEILPIYEYLMAIR